MLSNGLITGEGEQCDQMLELRVARFSPKLAQKVATAVFTSNVTLFEIAQKVF